VGGQSHVAAALSPGEKAWYALCRRLAGPSWPVWTVAGNFIPTGVRSPNFPARMESLYWLRFPGPLLYVTDNYQFSHSFNCKLITFNLYIVSLVLIRQMVDYCETGFQPVAYCLLPSYKLNSCAFVSSYYNETELLWANMLGVWHDWWVTSRDGWHNCCHLSETRTSTGWLVGRWLHVIVTA
jgi:hypothetical protein